MNDVQCVVLEGEADADGHEEGDHPVLRNEAVKRPVQIQGGGDDGHVVFAHANGEGASAASDVETDAETAFL